jgi:hypothetical protein
MIYKNKFRKAVGILLEVVSSAMLFLGSAYFFFLLYAFCLAPTGLFGMPNHCDNQLIFFQLLQIIPFAGLCFFRPLKNQKHFLISVIILAIIQLFIVVTHGITVVYTGGIPEVDWITTGSFALVLSILYLIKSQLL